LGSPVRVGCHLDIEKDIYALITGLWNLYDMENGGVIHKNLVGEKLPYVDPRWKERSFGENVHAKLMKNAGYMNII